MIVEAIVLMDTSESYSNKRGRKVQRVLCCLDNTKPFEFRLPNTFDYILSVLDEETFPAPFTRDAFITIGVTRIEPGQGGRPKFYGRLVQTEGLDGSRSRDPRKPLPCR